MPIIHTITKQEVFGKELGSVQKKTFMTYSYNELSDDAKEIAVNSYNNANGNIPREGWYELEHNSFAERLNEIGIEVDERTIRSSVGSQGSGASFEGRFNTDMDRPDQKKLEAKYGNEGVMLLGYFDEMQVIADNYFIVGKIIMSPSRPPHHDSMVVEAKAYRRIGDNIEEMSQEEYDDRDIDSEFEAIFRTLANLLHERVCNEYHYLISDEAIMKRLKNDHSVRFLESGRLYQEA